MTKVFTFPKKGAILISRSARSHMFVNDRQGVGLKYCRSDGQHNCLLNEGGFVRVQRRKGRFWKLVRGGMFIVRSISHKTHTLALYSAPNGLAFLSRFEGGPTNKMQTVSKKTCSRNIRQSLKVRKQLRTA